MYLEIISPEAVLLEAEVTSVSVPGVNGEFQMLDNHAPIISVLKEGIVRFEGKNPEFRDDVKSKFTKDKTGKWELPINSGTLEMKNNKVIILAD